MASNLRKMDKIAEEVGPREFAELVAEVMRRQARETRIGGGDIPTAEQWAAYALAIEELAKQ